MIRVVVLDLDGTLVDSLPDIAASVADTLRRIAPGVVPPDVAKIRSFVGEGVGMLIARSLAAAGLERKVEEVLPLYLEVYRGRLLDTTRFYPGALPALDALAGRTLCVLTNKPGDLSRDLLARLGAAHRFARIWGGGDTPTKKPDPAGLRKLMADFAATPRETVMVGDSPVDVATGRAAGVFTVGVRYGYDPAGLVAARPDAILEDLRELPSMLVARESTVGRVSKSP